MLFVGGNQGRQCGVHLGGVWWAPHAAYWDATWLREGCVVFCSVLCVVFCFLGSLANPDWGWGVHNRRYTSRWPHIYPASPLPGYHHVDVAPPPLPSQQQQEAGQAASGPILKAAVQNLTEHFKYSGCLRNSGGIQDVGPGQGKGKRCPGGSAHRTPPLPFFNAKQRKKVPSSIHPPTHPSIPSRSCSCSCSGRRRHLISPIKDLALGAVS